MPTIEERALALVNEVAGFDYLIAGDVMDDDRDYMLKALCRAIEALEALDAERAAHAQFRQEVSAAVEGWIAADRLGPDPRRRASEYLTTFILPKPVDPLVEVLQSAFNEDFINEDADNLRAALAKRGLKLVEVGDAD